ncbi:MAG: ketol-acid reductoisomerase [Brevibacillus sp.]|jgi:ketol-acid reductoisomerase|nr:ketol-acid reductoisomerase [Brevibacillus sp.]
MNDTGESQHAAPAYMQGKIVAIFGYCEEGFEQARVLRGSGIQVIVALRQGSSSDIWVEAGFPIVSIWDAADQAEIFQVW